jgi:hypothetical protein
METEGDRPTIGVEHGDDLEDISPPELLGSKIIFIKKEVKDSSESVLCWHLSWMDSRWDEDNLFVREEVRSQRARRWGDQLWEQVRETWLMFIDPTTTGGDGQEIYSQVITRLCQELLSVVDPRPFPSSIRSLQMVISLSILKQIGLKLLLESGVGIRICESKGSGCVGRVRVHKMLKEERRALFVFLNSHWRSHSNPMVVCGRGSIDWAHIVTIQWPVFVGIHQILKAQGDWWERRAGAMRGDTTY